MVRDLNREEIMALMRKHAEVFLNMLQPQNRLPTKALWSGTGPNSRGGLERLNELYELLKVCEPPASEDNGGE